MTGLLVVSGCRTAGRYHVAVGNVGTNDLAAVKVSFGGDVYFEPIDSLPSLGEHYFRPLYQLPANAATVSWTNARGEAVEQKKVFEKPFSASAHYRIYFQIEPDQSVKLFVDRVRQRDGSMMPWGKPANWEGTVAIPGLTGGDE